MQGWLNRKRAFKTFFCFFNRESKIQRNNNLNRTLLVCTVPWFGQFCHFSWTIKSNSQEKQWDFKCLIPLSSQRAEINVYYGTVPGTRSFLVSAAPGKQENYCTPLNALSSCRVSQTCHTIWKNIRTDRECRVEIKHKSLFHETFAYHRFCVMKWSTVCPWVLIDYIHVKKTIPQSELGKLLDAASIWQEGRSSLPKPTHSIYARGSKLSQGSWRTNKKQFLTLLK